MVDFYSTYVNTFASQFIYSLPKIYSSLHFYPSKRKKRFACASCPSRIEKKQKKRSTMSYDDSGPVINQLNPAHQWNDDCKLSLNNLPKNDRNIASGDGWMPSAPSPGLVLFNSEEQSDLIFIVTMDSNPEKNDLKFPGHSFIIRESSPIFNDIIHEINQRQSNSDQKPIINIQCRPETLHMLMR